MQPGQIVKVINNVSSHRFANGQLVRFVRELAPNCYLFIGNNQKFCLTTKEFKII